MAWTTPEQSERLAGDRAAEMERLERERDAAVAQRDALADALRTLDDLTDGCWDEGPPGEGWPSDELVEAHRKAREALAGVEEKPSLDDVLAHGQARFGSGEGSER